MPEALEKNLSPTVKSVVIGSIDEAAKRGASRVEAEHLLLSIAGSGDVASKTLAEFGLDVDGIDAALRDERAHALQAAGIEPVAEERLRATREGRPIWGASLREALRRADFRAHRSMPRAERDRLAVVDALVGVLGADLGTVPRALAYAGVDRVALIERLQRR